MSVTVRIEGLDKWRRIVDPERFTREIDRALQQASSMLRDETKKLPPVSAKSTGYAALGIPVDTGRLRQAIRSQRNGLMDYSVIADVNYSAAVHDGTMKMPPRPYFRWVLEEFGGLQKIELLIRAALTRVVTP